MVHETRAPQASVSGVLVSGPSHEAGCRVTRKSSPPSPEPEPGPLHPGMTLRATLEELDITQAELARRSGLTPKHVNQLIKGMVGLSFYVAFKLEQATGVPARLWNALEADYQDHQIRTGTRCAPVALPLLAKRLRAAGLADSAAALDRVIGETPP